MKDLLRKDVVRQQVKLLKFERYLRSIALVAIIGGLTPGMHAAASTHLERLASAKLVFANVDSTGDVSQLIAATELGLANELRMLLKADSVEERRTIMLSIFERVDNAHQVAEKSAINRAIRLLPNSADGGTPKRPLNVEWLRARLGF